VARQETECRALADRLGAEVVGVYADNDISAYSGKARPQYEAMLEAICTGQVDLVIAWHTDRLYRRTRDLQGYIDACQPRGVPTHTVQAGPLDLSTPPGRMVARQLGAVAEYESEQKGERERAANRQRAQQGKHFGTRRRDPDGSQGRSDPQLTPYHQRPTLTSTGALAGASGVTGVAGAASAALACALAWRAAADLRWRAATASAFARAFAIPADTWARKVKFVSRLPSPG